MYKSIVIKLCVLIGIFPLLNLLYNVSLYDADLREKNAEVADIRHTLKNTDVYYFGESSDLTTSASDSVKWNISQFVGLYFKKLRIVGIDKYASHAGVYRYWLHALSNLEPKPKAIVVTMNLRSFGEPWINSKLETQLQESNVLARPWPNLINRFALALQLYETKSPEEREKEVMQVWRTRQLVMPAGSRYKTVRQWDSLVAAGSFLNPDGSWDLPKIELACNYIKSYAFNIDASNPRVRDFDWIADWCKKNKISLYLNLMAENVQYADSLAGKDLVFLMRQNRDFLVKRYNNTNCTVIDNLELVKGHEFIDQHWTTEHYVQAGRMRIARNLARGLKKEFANYYNDLN